MLENQAKKRRMLEVCFKNENDVLLEIEEEDRKSLPHGI